MRLYYKTIGISAVCWIVCCLLIGKFDAHNDGYTEVGLPFVFVRYCSRKCFECLETGYFFWALFLDVLIVFIFSLVIAHISNRKLA